MIGKALFSPGVWKQNLLIAAAMGSAVILLGCGGGGGDGGGGNPPPASACGVGNGSTVLCGFVKNNAGAGVSGASVQLKTTAGANVGAPVLTQTNGFYVIRNVSANAALFQVNPPTGNDYFADTARFGGNTYLYYTQNQAKNGACIPAIPALTTGKDNLLTDVALFLVNSGPPAPPINGCPR